MDTYLSFSKNCRNNKTFSLVSDITLLLQIDSILSAEVIGNGNGVVLRLEDD